MSDKVNFQELKYKYEKGYKENRVQFSSFNNRLKQIESSETKLETVILKRDSVNEILNRIDKKRPASVNTNKNENLERLLLLDAEKSQLGAMKQKRVREEYALLKDLQEQIEGDHISSSSSSSLSSSPSKPSNSNTLSSKLPFPTNRVQSAINIQKKSNTLDYSKNNVKPVDSSPLKSEFLKPEPSHTNNKTTNLNVSASSRNSTVNNENEIPPLKSSKSLDIISSTSNHSEVSHLDRQSKWTIPFNDIDLVDELSRGSSGQVFRGHYLQTEIAIKRIKLVEGNATQKKQVEQEFIFLKDLNHPNLVQFLGFSRDPQGYIYFLTEFIQNGDLFDLIILGGNSDPLSWRNRVFIAQQIAQVGYYLHSKNVIHRDIKSQNILISDNFKIKLCDFGLAIKFETPKEKRIIGSDLWLAPEISLERTDYDCTIDIFSFGIICTELILYELPQTRPSSVNYQFDTNYFLDHVPQEAPDDFVLITLESTQSEFEKRPSFKEIISRLKKVCESLN